MSDEKRRIGKFWVGGHYAGERERFEHLRIAQAGCAVLRCEFHAYSSMFEVTAIHPDFEEVEIMRHPPEYNCEFTKYVGGALVRKFVKMLDGRG